MLKQKGYIGGLVTLVAVALLVVFVWVNSVQGQADELIGVVNTQAVFTQYLAGPLFELAISCRQSMMRKLPI